MDWIEKLIGLSPDGGDGTAEAAVVLACVAAFGAVLAVRVPRLRQRMRAMLEAWENAVVVPENSIRVDSRNEPESEHHPI